VTAIRALIVDDVPLARERVRRYLEDEPDVDIIGEAEDGVSALRLVTGLLPDLVFLDVQLPDFDGIEITRRLPLESRSVVIYLTAHDDRAIAAFEAGALDYLVKPFTHERFERALNRARVQLRLRSNQNEVRPADYLRRLVITDRRRTEIVAVSDIDYVDVAGHYLCVHVGKSIHLIRGVLGELEQQLDPAQFARVHRSAIVRLDRIRSLTSRSNGDSTISLADGCALALSRTYADLVRAKLEGVAP
jgi:two-component system LytT family response regulator